MSAPRRVCACEVPDGAKIYTHTRFFPTIRSFSLSLFLPWRDRRPAHPNERTNAKRGKRDLRERHADCKKEKRERNGMMHLLWMDPYHRRTTQRASRFKKKISPRIKKRERGREEKNEKKSDCERGNRTFSGASSHCALVASHSVSLPNIFF